MGLVFSLLLRLDATAACVALFVVALGSLWLYVALAKPSQSSREYERLEGLLRDTPAAATAGGVPGGKREGRRGRGKKGATVEGSPRSRQSQRKKKSSSPETMPSSENGTGTRPDETETKKRRKSSSPLPKSADVAKQPAVAKKQSPPPAKSADVAKQPAVAKKQSPPPDDEGEFQLVTTKSSRGKKETAPVATASSPETVSKKQKAAAMRKTSSAEKVIKGGKGEIPVVKPIAKNEADTLAVSKATTTKEEDPVVTPATKSELHVVKGESAAKEEAPVISKRTRGKRRGGNREREDGGGERTVSSGSGEEEGEREGEWHTQLSRQQLRAIKQKEKDKELANQPQTSLPSEREREERVRERERKNKQPLPKKREGEGEREKKRERASDTTKTWNKTTSTEGGGATQPEATPTKAAVFSADESSEGPVATGNLTDLEKAIREAACTSSSSSEDITSLQVTTTTTTTVVTSDSSSLATHAEATPTNNIVFPSATVSMDTGVKEGLGNTEEASQVPGTESPDSEDWVVLDPPT